MKKIMNKDTEVVEQMVSGMTKAYERHFERIEDKMAIMYKGRRKDKVVLVIGGGSGHEPVYHGFVGKGLADAAAIGNIFASPNPELIADTAKAVEQGKGVLFVYGNYAGDNLNFDMAEELLEFDDIKTAHVRVMDDCASAPKERMDDRRGIAGSIYMMKIAGSACDAGLDLDEVVRIVTKAQNNINSIGLATSPGSIPGLDKPTFELGENEIEFGMGLHGEPGIERTTMQPAKDLVTRMYTEIKAEMGLKAGDEIAVLVNGLGSTTVMELDIVYNDLYDMLKADNLIIHDAEVKSFCTCQEMGGFSITILKLDEELKKYYDTACYSPYYARGEIR